MRGRRLWLFFLVLLVAFLCRGASARAMEPEELEEEQLEQYDYDEIDEALEELFPEEQLDFGETLGEVLSGMWLSLPAFSTGWCMTSFFTPWEAAGRIWDTFF